ncbi:hypothetical protein HanRHA438_Chr14g0679921 [Helianthus annuus]|nr:hypothetical protein HanRHA438_Chr14g0679921 [Helianthus annuus]
MSPFKMSIHKRIALMAWFVQPDSNLNFLMNPNPKIVSCIRTHIDLFNPIFFFSKLYIKINIYNKKQKFI